MKDLVFDVWDWVENVWVFCVYKFDVWLFSRVYSFSPDSLLSVLVARTIILSGVWLVQVDRINQALCYFVPLFPSTWVVHLHPVGHPSTFLPLFFYLCSADERGYMTNDLLKEGGLIPSIEINTLYYSNQSTESNNANAKRKYSYSYSYLRIVIYSFILILASYTWLNMSSNLNNDRQSKAGAAGESVGRGGKGKVLEPRNYTVVQGFFIQSDPSFGNVDYDPLNDSFGLIDKSPNRWRDFERSVLSLSYPI